jgi:F420-0:gamma-glutamyl ligase
VEHLWAHLKEHDPSLYPRDLWELSTEARAGLRRMRRRPTHVAALWKQAELVVTMFCNALQVVFRESPRIVRMDRGVLVVERHLGFVCANASVYTPNRPYGCALTLPRDPDASARGLRRGISDDLGVARELIVCDTFGRPSCEGLTNLAIGLAGSARSTITVDAPTPSGAGNRSRASPWPTDSRRPPSSCDPGPCVG